MRKAEEFATNQGVHWSNTQKSKNPSKINIDEYKTEALDDLFGVSNEANRPFEEDEPVMPMRSSAPQQIDTHDIFAESDHYHDEPMLPELDGDEIQSFMF